MGDGTTLPAEEGKQTGWKEGRTRVAGERTDLPKETSLQGEEDSALEISETTSPVMQKKKQLLQGFEHANAPQILLLS